LQWFVIVQTKTTFVEACFFFALNFNINKILENNSKSSLPLLIHVSSKIWSEENIENGDPASNEEVYEKTIFLSLGSKMSLMALLPHLPPPLSNIFFRNQQFCPWSPKIVLRSRISCFWSLQLSRISSVVILDNDITK